MNTVARRFDSHLERKWLVHDYDHAQSLIALSELPKPSPSLSVE